MIAKDNYYILSSNLEISPSQTINCFCRARVLDANACLSPSLFLQEEKEKEHKQALLDASNIRTNQLTYFLSGE